MSANKSTDSSSESSQVVVGGGKKPKGTGLKSRLTLVGAIVLLVAFVGACGVLAYQKLSSNSNESDLTQSAKVPSQAAKMNEVNGKKVTETQRSQQAVYYGEYEKGQQILNDQLASAKDDNAKIALYIQLATNALNAKKYDEANGYAQKALAIKKTAGTYSLLAVIASSQGNKQQAINYANEQKKLLDPKSSAYEIQVEDIDNFIKEQQ